MTSMGAAKKKESLKSDYTGCNYSNTKFQNGVNDKWKYHHMST